MTVDSLVIQTSRRKLLRDPENRFPKVLSFLAGIFDQVGSETFPSFRQLLCLAKDIQSERREKFWPVRSVVPPRSCHGQQAEKWRFLQNLDFFEKFYRTLVGSKQNSCASIELIDTKLCSLKIETNFNILQIFSSFEADLI